MLLFSHKQKPSHYLLGWLASAITLTLSCESIAQRYAYEYDSDYYDSDYYDSYEYDSDYYDSKSDEASSGNRWSDWLPRSGNERSSEEDDYYWSYYSDKVDGTSKLLSTSQIEITKADDSRCIGYLVSPDKMVMLASCKDEEGAFPKQFTYRQLYKDKTSSLLKLSDNDGHVSKNGTVKIVSLDWSDLDSRHNIWIPQTTGLVANTQARPAPETSEKYLSEADLQFIKEQTGCTNPERMCFQNFDGTKISSKGSDIKFPEKQWFCSKITDSGPISGVYYKDSDTCEVLSESAVDVVQGEILHMVHAGTSFRPFDPDSSTPPSETLPFAPPYKGTVNSVQHACQCDSGRLGMLAMNEPRCILLNPEQDGGYCDDFQVLANEVPSASHSKHFHSKDNSGWVWPVSIAGTVTVSVAMFVIGRVIITKLISKHRAPIFQLTGDKVPLLHQP